MSNSAQSVRCDEPGCESRVTRMYLVGLGGWPAYYCTQHAPAPHENDIVLSHYERDVFTNKPKLIEELDRAEQALLKLYVSTSWGAVGEALRTVVKLREREEQNTDTKEDV